MLIPGDTSACGNWKCRWSSGGPSRVGGGHAGSPVPEATCHVSWVQWAAAGCVQVMDPHSPDLLPRPHPKSWGVGCGLGPAETARGLLPGVGALSEAPSSLVLGLVPLLQRKSHPLPPLTLCLSPPSTPHLYTPASPWAGWTLTRGEQGWAGVSCPPPPPPPRGAQLDLGTAEWDLIGRVAGQAWLLGALGPMSQLQLMAVCMGIPAPSPDRGLSLLAGLGQMAGSVSLA